MGSKMNSQFLRMSVAAGVIVLALAGCSSNSSGNFPPPGAAMTNGKPTGPPPKIADCALTNSGSPTKYVCNGKTYTTFQLNKMRMDYEKQQAAGM
jgi:hypothetical protein